MLILQPPQEGDTPVVNGHTEEAQPETNAATASPDQANGTVAPADETTDSAEATTEKAPKKHKNPITWIQRRISKKSLSFNFGGKTSVDKTAAQNDEEKPADESLEKNDDAVTSVADNLVNEVITTATAITQSEQGTPKTTTQVVTEAVQESEVSMAFLNLFSFIDFFGENQI